jgi:hypothetical protein
MSYRAEMFSLAILEMASGDARVQERLMSAVVRNNLLFLDEHFEDDLRDEYIALKDTLVREGSLSATIEKMTSDEAFFIIDKIMTIYHELCKRGE